MKQTEKAGTKAQNTTILEKNRGKKARVLQPLPELQSILLEHCSSLYSSVIVFVHFGAKFMDVTVKTIFLPR